jgi:hypothetical protein
MKKTLLLFTLLFSFQAVCHAQNGGPDLYGYIWRDTLDPSGPDYNWVDIKSKASAEQISGLSDDNSVGPFQLPAPFPYYWYTVNQFWIGSNGYISFGPANISSQFPSIPSTLNPQNYIAVMLSDLNFDGAGNYGSCWRWTSALGDSVIVTWDSVPFWQQNAPTYTGANSFQLILNYNDSSITFQYKDQLGATSGATSGFLTTGIENNSGNIGLQVLQDMMPMPETAVRFYAPSTTSLLINDASTTYNDNPENGAKFLSANGAPFPLVTEVKNTGNTVLNPFTVQVAVRNQFNALAISITDTTNTLAQGSSEVLTMSNPFTPVVPGSFRMITNTQLPGDATPSNNQRILELQVVDTTQNEIELAYDDGNNTAGGISWSGGNAGAANYFIPPFYPCTLSKIKAFIASDASNFGYSMMVYADDGPNGLAGTLLDSIKIPGGSFSTGVYTTTPLTTPLNIISGGFYVTWFMGGNNVTLGTNGVTSTLSGSNRGFEVLANNYSEWRSRETQDLMIRAIITRVGVGNEEIASDGLGDLYPNPASDLLYLDLKEAIKTNNAVLQVFDMNGRLVYSNRLISKNNRVELNVSGLSNGLYTIRIQDGNNQFSRNLNVIH